MKVQWKKLIVSLLLPLAVGGAAALLTKDGMGRFETVIKPPLSPPAWIFPVAWTLLYILMGVACYLVWTARKKEPNALFYYGIQLFLNFFWPIIFFNIRNDLFEKFSITKKAAGYLLLPYLVWTTFAAYLNLGIYLLNR